MLHHMSHVDVVNVGATDLNYDGARLELLQLILVFIKVDLINNVNSRGDWR